MRIINFADGFTSASEPTVDQTAESVSVVPAGDLASTNVQDALEELQGDIDTAEAAHTSHTSNVSNPHSVTKTQVGLSNVTNDAQIPLAQKGAVSGVAELDSGGKVPTAQLPDSVVGSVEYQSTWDADTNTPALGAVPEKGHYYVVSVAGATSLSGITDWAVGDWAISNGTTWEKVDNTESVVSVAGRTGVITLTSTDVGLANVDNTSDATKNAAAATLENKTIASPTVTGTLLLQNPSGAQPELHLSEDPDNGTNVVKIKAPATLAGDVTLTLPDTDGDADQVLKTDGSGVLGWATPATTALAQYNVRVGDSGGVQAQANTNLLGDFKASITSTTVTMTIATPCVVTHTSHGKATGDRIYLTTTGALPTGLTASTAYYVIKVDANTYNLATSRANAVAGTKIASSGSQSGVHTATTGGLEPLSSTDRYPGSLDGVAPGSGYVGQVLSTTISGVGFGTSATTLGSLSITPGVWLVIGTVTWLGAGTTGIRHCTAGISANNNSLSGCTAGMDYMGAAFDDDTRQSTGNGGGGLTLVRVLTLSATATYYLVGQTNTGTAPSGGIKGGLRAVRIA